MSANAKLIRAIGKNVLRFRTAKALTQGELGQAIGLKSSSRSFICRVESGKGHVPNMENLQALANALGVTVNDLIAA